MTELTADDIATVLIGYYEQKGRKVKAARVEAVKEWVGYGPTETEVATAKATIEWEEGP